VGPEATTYSGLKSYETLPLVVKGRGSYLKSKTTLDQGPRPLLRDLDVQAFLNDCQVRNLAPTTLAIYRRHLGDLASWLRKPLSEASIDDLRAYFLALRERRNPGGQHQAFRTLRAFYRWLEAEGIIAASPMRRLKPPRVPEKTLDPVPLEHVQALLKTCEGKRLTDLRDTALILALVDTGARANELLSVNLADVDPSSGTVFLRETKGKRPRAVFLGKRALRALLRYLKARGGTEGALWLSEDGTRLTYWGLRQILRRRAKKAGVPAPSPHAFRRLFALQSLRSGLDVISLQRLLGHRDLSVIQRYLKQTVDDLREAHNRHSPGDLL